MTRKKLAEIAGVSVNTLNTNIKLLAKTYIRSGNFFLSSGQESQYFIDLKEAMGQPHLLEGMIDYLSKKIITKPNVIVGLEFGGIPLAVGLSLKLKIPFAILRKKRNEHGMRKRIEGYQKKGKAIIVDDVYQSGMSTTNAETYLTYCGYKVLQTLTIMERDLEGNLKNG